MLRQSFGQPLRLSLCKFLGFAALISPQIATSAPRCADLPSPIYVAGAASAAPLLKSVAPLLLADADQATVVYQMRPSCAAVEAVARDTDPMQCQQGACLYGQASFFTLDGSAKVCDLAPSGTHAHLALSDVFAQSCPAFGGGTPRGILDVPGPVSSLVVVTQKSSPENSLHASEAHFLFNLGKAGEIVPWNNEETIYIRDERSAGQILLSYFAKVPPGRFKGTVANDPEDVLLRLSTGEARTSLGFIPQGLYDQRRTEVKALALQAFGQRAAYFPDRTPSSFDKINVRDGHYPLWGYLHMIGQGNPMAPDRMRSIQAQRLSDLLTGRTSLAGKDGLELQVRAGLVPQCAMKVARQKEGAPLGAFTPLSPCGCWFDKVVPSGKTSCTTCTDDTMCGGGRCRRGYCEER